MKALSLLVVCLALTASCSDDSAAAVAAVPLEPPPREGWNPDGPWPGFTLFGPLKSVHVQLVDMAGEAVHSWETPTKPGAAVAAGAVAS